MEKWVTWKKNDYQTLHKWKIRWKKVFSLKKMAIKWDLSVDHWDWEKKKSFWVLGCSSKSLYPEKFDLILLAFLYHSVSCVSILSGLTKGRTPCHEWDSFMNPNKHIMCFVVHFLFVFLFCIVVLGFVFCGLVLLFDAWKIHHILKEIRFFQHILKEIRLHR